MRRTDNLIVFVRAPMLGAVKRRLAAGIGALAARRLYAGLTAGLLRRVGRDRRWRTWLAVTPDRFARTGGFWPADIPRLAQGRGDLGRRMARAMARFPRAKVVLVGSDVPDIEAADIARALEALDGFDAVFGPAADGGYWLVALRDGRMARGLFDGVRWSGPHALADTLNNLGGRRVALLRTLEDIDDTADLARRRGRT